MTGETEAADSCVYAKCLGMAADLHIRVRLLVLERDDARGLLLLKRNATNTGNTGLINSCKHDKYW